MLNIRKCGHRDLDRFYPMLELDFDSEERISKLNIHKAMLEGNMELLSVYDEESNVDLAYALVICKGLYGYVLLKYFGVFPWYRDHGVGVDAMRLLNKRYADRQGILAEITEFEDDYPDHVKKLLRFFARFGYVEVKCDHKLGGVKAHLLIKPIKGTHEIESVAHRIVKDFYSRVLPYTTMERMVDIRPIKEVK